MTVNFSTFEEFLFNNVYLSTDNEMIHVTAGIMYGAGYIF